MKKCKHEWAIKEEAQKIIRPMRSENADRWYEAENGKRFMDHPFTLYFCQKCLEVTAR